MTDYRELWVTKPQDGFDCHCPTLEEIDPNTLLACWYGGSGIKQCDEDPKMEQTLWSSHFTNEEWSQPTPILHSKTKCWNPVLFQHKVLHLFYKEGPSPRSWVGKVMHSHDGGFIWEKPELLPQGILGPMRSRPLITKEGTWIVGSSTESGSLKNKTATTACHIEISKDEGKSWVKRGPIKKKKTNRLA